MSLSISYPAAEPRGSGRGRRARSNPFPLFSKILHWSTAILVLALFGAGVVMKQLGDGPTANALYTFHKTAGVTLLGLVVIRLSYRIFAQLTGRWALRSGSRPVHALLYGALILVPLLGWAGLSDFGAREIYLGMSLPAIWPEGAGYAAVLFKSHALLAFTLLALVVVHIVFAVGDYIQHGAAGRLTNKGDILPTESSSHSQVNVP